MRLLPCLPLLVTLHLAGMDRPIGEHVGQVVDLARDRVIDYRLVYPLGADGALPVLLISHGGSGRSDGHLTTLTHLGPAFARAGYLAVHLNHAPSATNGVHRLDRPTDVSRVIDAAVAGSWNVPTGVTWSVDAEAIGHIGHSWGAFTALSLAGAVFDHGVHDDPRVRAVVAISPQGPDQFGSFDRGPVDNSWYPIRIPLFVLVGGEEQHGSAGGGVGGWQWRLFPFLRGSGVADAWLALLDGQDHGQMGNSGSPAVQDYIASNSRAFFDAALRGDAQAAIGVGRQAWLPGTTLARRWSDSTRAAVVDRLEGWRRWDWQTDLAFDELPADGRPLPNNAMNLAVHAGALYCGTATSREIGGYSSAAAYIFRKDSAQAAWQLDADFPPGSSRVGALLSAHLERDGTGAAITEGPQELLLAACNGSSDDPVGIDPPIWQRDQATGAWQQQSVGSERAGFVQIRALVQHRDAITGADLIVAGASPEPFGLYVGRWDSSSSSLQWSATPELTAGASKWFGLTSANGGCYAASRQGIHRRIDGDWPASWELVVPIDRFPATGTREPRGLAALPTASDSGWPEPAMLLVSMADGVFRIRAGADHALQREVDCDALLAAQVGWPVRLSESGFAAWQPVGERWLSGVQFTFGDPDGTVVAPIDPASGTDLTGQAAYSAIGYLLQRDRHGRYAAASRLQATDAADRPTVLPRAVLPSPFPEEVGVVYACGYNASVVTATSGERQLGRAWVYRGTPAAGAAVDRRLQLQVLPESDWRIEGPSEVWRDADGAWWYRRSETATGRLVQRQPAAGG